MTPTKRQGRRAGTRSNPNPGDIHDSDSSADPSVASSTAARATAIPASEESVPLKPAGKPNGKGKVRIHAQARSITRAAAAQATATPVQAPPAPAGETPPRRSGRPRSGSVPNPPSTVTAAHAPEAPTLDLTRSNPGRKLGMTRRAEAEIINRIVTMIGADELSPILLTQPESSKYRALTRMLTDPALSKLTLPELCDRAHIAWSDLLHLYRTHQLDVAQIQLHRKLPAIAADLADDAAAAMKTCPDCSGHGWNWGTELHPESVEDLVGGFDKDMEPLPPPLSKMPCIPCEGTGQVRKDPEPAARELALKMAGVVGSDRSINIGIHASTNLNFAGRHAEFVSVSAKLTSGMLEPPMKAADPVSESTSDSDSGSHPTIDVDASPSPSSAGGPSSS